MTSRQRPRPGGGRPCTAKTTKGRPCRAFAVRGSNVCIAHGAAAPQVREAAAQRVQQIEVKARVGKVLADVERQLAVEGVGPLDVLENAGTRAAAMVVVISSMLDELTTVTAFGEVAPTAVAHLYERWVKLAGQISKAQLDAGIAERRHLISKRDTAIVINMLKEIEARLLTWLSDHEVDRAVLAELRSAWGKMVRDATRTMTQSEVVGPPLVARRVSA